MYRYIGKNRKNNFKKYFHVTSGIFYSGIYQYIFIEKVYIFYVHCVQIALSLVRVRTQRFSKWYILCTLYVQRTNFVYVLVYLTNTVSLIYDIIESKGGDVMKEALLTILSIVLNIFIIIGLGYIAVYLGLKLPYQLFQQGDWGVAIAQLVIVWSWLLLGGTSK